MQHVADEQLLSAYSVAENVAMTITCNIGTFFLLLLTYRYVFIYEDCFSCHPTGSQVMSPLRQL